MTYQELISNTISKFDNELSDLKDKRLEDLTDGDLERIAKILAEGTLTYYDAHARYGVPKCIVVNLFGAPGSGKSTGAAYIYSYLKARGIDAELVTEFAKDLVWDGREDLLNDGKDQPYIFGEQLYRMNRCRDKVKVIVTDSPLPLSIVYNKSEILGENFNQVVMDCFNSFDNLSYFLVRSKAYSQNGRMQTEQESDNLMEMILDMMAEREIPYVYAKGDESFYKAIGDEVISAALGMSSIGELMGGRVTVETESEG